MRHLKEEKNEAERKNQLLERKMKYLNEENVQLKADHAKAVKELEVTKEALTQEKNKVKKMLEIGNS